jgi:hypothetical protein
MAGVMYCITEMLFRVCMCISIDLSAVAEYKFYELLKQVFYHHMLKLSYAMTVYNITYIIPIVIEKCIHVLM